MISLESQIEQLLAENARLRNLLGSEEIQDLTQKLCVEYIYAAPLVLLDAMGSTVIETFDPLRISAELFSIQTAADWVSVTVATTLNLSSLLRKPSPAWIAHISMHTVESGSLRCAIEDESGKGCLMSPSDFVMSLNLTHKSLVFINACKSLEIARVVLSLAPSVKSVVCTSEPVSDTAALLFASEFYANLRGGAVGPAFARAQTAVRLSSNLRISEQYLLFQLLEQPGEVCRLYPVSLVVSTSFATINNSDSHVIGYLDPAWTRVPEDYVGRQVDTVRLCARLFGRRVCAVTGSTGMGKSVFLSEASKFLSAPGGRHFAGGICLVDGKNKYVSCDFFIQTLAFAVGETVKNLKRWYGASPAPRNTPPEVLEDCFDVEHKVPVRDVSGSSGRGRFDSGMSDISDLPYGLKSYKVFWAETFASETELEFFLKSYKLILTDVARLFSELRLNGTQLQDWGAGRLIRVVHVVRLLIRGNNTVLLEQTRLPSKKFDPVTENVLEIASITVRKEFPLDVSIAKVVLRDRKPMIEISKTSPSYPGLATKYVLYTVEVSVSGLPNTETFTTVESSGKQHSWTWKSADSNEVVALLPDAPRRPSRTAGSLELSFSTSGANFNTSGSGDQLAWNQCLREWNDLVELINRSGGTNVSAGLVMVNAEEYMRDPAIVELLGKALSRHSGLRILFSAESTFVQAFTTASVSYKVVQFPLPPLEPIDAAILFTRRIHRPLFTRDWHADDDDAPPPLMTMGSVIGLDEDEEAPLAMSARTSRGVANLARLARHPLIQSLEGIPARILILAEKVTFDLFSINELKF